MNLNLFFKFLTICGLVILSGCFYQSDEQVLQRAEESYQVLSARYADLLDSADDVNLIADVRCFGIDYRTGSFWYAANVEDAEIAPLHRALNIINNDIQLIRKHMNCLEARLLSSTRIFGKLLHLNEDLQHVRQVIKVDDAYIDEARALEARELQRAQLAEAQQQTCLLAGLACAVATPVVCEERVVTRVKPASCSSCERPVRCVSQTRVVSCNPCKKKKSHKKVVCQETDFNTDDVPRGATVVV